MIIGIARCFLLLVLLHATAPLFGAPRADQGSQAPSEAIRRYVSEVDGQKLPVETRDVSTGTDFGGSLLIYGGADRPVRMRLTVGLSRSDVVTDYYFQAGRLCFVRRCNIEYDLREDGLPDTSKVLRRTQQEHLIPDTGKAGTTRPASEVSPLDAFAREARFLMAHRGESVIDLEPLIK